MKEQISLLIVEDSQADADLMIRELENSGLQVRKRRVDTETGLLQALEDSEWDIIISDYKMPSFDAFRVLEVVKGARPLLPLIIVSGWIDINMAVSLMKEGARDYVQKSELVRLPRAVEMVIREVQLEAENQAMMRALAESEQHLADIIDCLPDATLVINDEGRVILWNRAMEKMTGVAKEQIIGRGQYEYSLPFYGERRPMLIDLAFHPGSENSPYQNRYNKLQRNGEILMGEVQLPQNARSEGAYVWGSASRLYDLHGNPVGAIQSIRDISERKRHEDALGKWAQIFQKTGWGVVVCAADDCRVEMFNPAFVQMHGLSGDEIENKSIFDLYPPEMHDALKRRIREAQEQGHVAFETRRLGRNSKAFPASVDITAVKDEQGRVAFLIGSIQDISDRKRTEEERDSLKYLMNTIINSMPSMIMAVDCEGRVIQWNAEAERRTGLTCKAAVGRFFNELLPDYGRQLPGWERALREKATISEMRINCLRDESLRACEVMICPLDDTVLNGAVIRIDDITEKVRMEEMMVQTEKMMSVGGLAAGMAHEINNPLGGILQGATNIQRRLDMGMEKNRQAAQRLGLDPLAMEAYIQERQVNEIVSGVRQAGQRASAIISNMLQFSRRSNSKKEWVSLAQVVDETLELASKDYDLERNFDFRHIRIIRDYSPDVPPIYCVRNEIEQVIFNLLINAAQALREMERPPSRPQIAIRLKLKANMAIIEVEDNGPGMEEYVKKRIFEPFFTTKDVGKGTGLGLSVAYFIIRENHRGQMQVISQPGRGARFIIKLPGNEQNG